MLFKALKAENLTLLTKDKRSQSALEYMMTYGWAILIIVIVAVILYSMGIFNPSSSITTTITGFQSLGVTQAACINSVNNQILELYVTNNVGYPINLTKINVTGNNGVTVTQDIGSLLYPGHSSSFYVNGACNKSSSSYSGSVTITYMEVGQPLPGPYLSIGKITRVPSKSNPNLVGSFNGASSQIVSKLLLNTSTITISAWLDEITFTNCWKNIAFVSQTSPLNIFAAGTTCGAGGAWRSSPSQGPLSMAGNNVGNTWNHIIAEWNGNTGELFVYFDGSNSSYQVSGDPIYFFINTVNIGGAISELGDVNYFDGSISNVQVYDTILSVNQINNLNLTGKGGAPIPNAGLVGWWPLDGNANDYSANNNNGVATNVNWISP